MPRTSVSDPLAIAEVRCRSGWIGMTFCPGKCGNSVFGEPWLRDLATDIEVIRGWGAVVVVTLMEPHELDTLRVRGLGAAVEQAGLEWLHLPIRDLAAPDQMFEWAWTTAGEHLHAQLRSGRRLLIHCRGGRGRTGVVAARLLVEAGEPALVAIARVREARDGAIETAQQFEYVTNLSRMLCDRADLQTSDQAS